MKTQNKKVNQNLEELKNVLPSIDDKTLIVLVDTLVYSTEADIIELCRIIIDYLKDKSQ